MEHVILHGNVRDLVRWDRTFKPVRLAVTELLSTFGEQLDDAKSPPAVPSWEEVATAIDSQIEQVTQGSASPEDACAAMQQEAESIGTGL